MIRVFTILAVACLAIGCRPYPRYRWGGSERPLVAIRSDVKYSTNDYLRLGMILRKYLGKPYKGSSKYLPGLDCSKFTSSVFREFDRIELPRTVADQLKSGTQVVRTRLKFGDLVFFRTERNRVSHVGIFVGNNSFIHASSSRGVIITSLNEPYWAKRFADARRILEQ